MNIEKEIEVKTVQKETTKAPSSGPNGGVLRDTKGDANKGIYMMPPVGGNGGHYFERTLFDDTNKRFRRIRKLEVSIEDQVAMRGIRVTFDNGEEKTAGDLPEYTSIFGRADIFPMDLNVSENEVITRTTIYECPLINVLSLSTPMVNGIVIQTNKNQLFSHLAGFRQVFNVSLQQTPHEDTTCGVLIGIYGLSGDYIDQLGLILELPTDEEYIFEDVQYQLTDYKHFDQKPLTVKKATVNNDTDAMVAQKVAVSHTYSKTQSWSNTYGLKVGAKTTVKAGVPAVCEGGLEISAELSASFQVGGSSTETVTDQWEVTVNAPPKSHVQVTAAVTMSEISVPFIAKLIKCKSDGTRETVPGVSGVYHGVTVSDFNVKAETLT